jgi:hypothetical protein
MKKSPVKIDVLLEPLLLEASDEQADEVLLRLITDHAEPVIKGVIRYKLHLSSYRATQRAEAEDIYQEVILQLLAQLQQFRKQPGGHPITTRRVERSSQLKGLSRPPSSLMSSDEQRGEFSVIEPVGTVLMNAQPTFRWSSMEGATGYVVEVYDDNFQLAAASPQITNYSWAAPQSLSRGKVYAWQVKAMKDGQEVTSPRPPAPQAKFRILDQAKANELAQARRAYASSHLTLALLYAEAGLLKESEQELRKLRKANPDSELARNLLRQVHALRRRSE